MRTTTNTHTTLTTLIRAWDRHHPVTITTTREDGTTTVRTIETTDIHTTKSGHIVIRAHDRDTADLRTFRLDRITRLTVHRTAYTSPTTPAPATPRSGAAIVARELGRDYHPARTAYAPAA